MKKINPSVKEFLNFPLNEKLKEVKIIQNIIRNF